MRGTPGKEPHIPYQIGPNGTGKWVVEVISSHLVFFLYKMKHSTVLAGYPSF